MGKAKPAKHTTAEINRKIDAATTNRGGGKAGKDDRMGGAVGHSRYGCAHCGATAPSVKSMQAHHESKHPGVPWSEEEVVDKHAATGGVTTQGVAVRGSTKK